MLRYLPLAMLALTAGTQQAWAVSFSFSGSAAGAPIAANAQFTLGADTVQLLLTNTTPTTYSSDQVLTAFNFTIAGSGTLSNATGATQKVAVKASGTPMLGALIDVFGANTWAIDTNDVNDAFRLTFNPDAQYGIIASASSYASANGSIRNNPGHNPFANGSILFTFDAPGVTSDSAVTNARVFFGTDFGHWFDPGNPDRARTVVPVPSSLILLLSMALPLAALHLVRRQRADGSR